MELTEGKYYTIKRITVKVYNFQLTKFDNQSIEGVIFGTGTIFGFHSLCDEEINSIKEINVDDKN